MLQHQIVADLDKGLLNADAGNIEQASQYYCKGEENIDRLPRPKIQNFEHRYSQQRHDNSQHAAEHCQHDQYTEKAENYRQKAADFIKPRKGYLPDHIKHQRT